MNNPKNLNQTLTSSSRKQLKDYIYFFNKIKISNIENKKYWLNFYKENIKLEKQILKSLQGFNPPDKEIEVENLEEKIISKYKQLTQVK